MEAPHPVFVTIAFAIASLAGQAVNAWLNLKMRNSLLDMEKRIMGEAACKFRDAEVCEAIMSGIERRIRVLEDHQGGAPHAA